MSAKVKIGVVATAAALVATYGVTQAAKDKSEEKTITVTSTWSPSPHRTGVRIIVRVAMKDHVKGKIFKVSPFTETYTVKRGDQAIITVEAVGFVDIKLGCSISQDGVEVVRDAGSSPGPKGRAVCPMFVK